MQSIEVSTERVRKRRNASKEANTKGAMVRVAGVVDGKEGWKERMWKRGWSVRETGEEGRKNRWCLRVE